MDETIKLYESILKEIKNGKMVCKTVNGNNVIMLSQSTGDVSVTKKVDYIIDLKPNGAVAKYCYSSIWF